MPQPIASESSEFSLRASSAQRLANGLLIAVLLALGGLVLPIPALLLWAALLLLLGRQLDRRIQQCGGVAMLRFDAEGWAIGDAAAQFVPVQWQSSTAVLSVAVVLRWREGWRWRGLLITPDMLTKSDYRRLCRLLWQAPVVDTAA